MSVKTTTPHTDVSKTRGQRLTHWLVRALPAVVISAVLSAGLGWTAATQGLSPWSSAYLFVLILTSLIAWQGVRRALGGWTALAALSLGWAALTFLGAVSGALCGGQVCPSSEVAAYTLTGALTPLTAVLLISPLLALGWAGKRVYGRVSARMGDTPANTTSASSSKTQSSAARSTRKETSAAGGAERRPAIPPGKRTRVRP